MLGVQKASLNMLWEYSTNSANLTFDWLRAKQSSPVDEAKRKRKMDDGIDISLASGGTDLFVDLSLRPRMI